MLKDRNIFIARNISSIACYSVNAILYYTLFCNHFSAVLQIPLNINKRNKVHNV